MRIGIIIPCYNEEKRINVDAFIQFIKTKENYHLCFVNDGSKDNTLTVLENIKSEAITRVSIIDVKKNKGKAAAVRVGARYLFNRQNVDYIGYMNADSLNDYDDYENFISELESEDSLAVFRSIGNASNLKKGFFKKIFLNFKQNVSKVLFGLKTENKKFGILLFSRKMAPVIYKKENQYNWSLDYEFFVMLKIYLKEEVLKMKDKPNYKLIYVQK